MATDIASKEPTQIRAGDTIEWKRSIDDYKASDGWTLKYAYFGMEYPKTAATWSANGLCLAGSTVFQRARY